MSELFIHNLLVTIFISVVVILIFIWLLTGDVAEDINEDLDYIVTKGEKYFKEKVYKKRTVEGEKAKK